MAEKLIGVINHILIKKGQKIISDLNNNKLLRDDLGFDSLDLAELTVRVEDEFGVDIFKNGIIRTTDEILEQLKTEN